MSSKYAGHPDYILNPKTGRWVKKSGAIGKTLISGAQSRAQSRAQPRAQPRAQSSAQPRVQSRAQSSVSNFEETLKPPEFMPPNPLSSEGYWDNHETGNGSKYLPIISKLKWKNKDTFVNLVKQIETTAMEGALVSEPEKYANKLIKISYKGYSPSRIDGTLIGNEEYTDIQYGISWPEGYVLHYIKRYNVMPTQKFFKYVINKSKDLKLLQNLINTR